MVTLFCAIVGVDGNAFSIDIDASKSVDHLKKAIWAEAITEELKRGNVASKLQLYLAKKDDTWLTSDDADVKRLKKGEKTSVIDALTHEDNELQGESSLNKVLSGMPEPSTDQIHVLVVVPESGRAKKHKVEHMIDDSMSDQLKSFKNSKMDDECINAPTILSYYNEQLGKLFVRKCYKDIFDLFIGNIRDRVELKIPGTRTSFGISGTPGIGKSLFFVYILYRLVHTESPFKPKRIVYQTHGEFTIFDLETDSVRNVDKVGVRNLVLDPATFYIIDGRNSIPVRYPLSTVAMYIASPRSDNYKEFVKQTNAQEWFLPVWTLNELEACRERCYPDFSIDTLDEQYRMYGGVARFVFQNKGSAQIEACMADADAIKGVRNVGHPTSIFPTTHTLLHCIVSDDGNYKFKHVDIASKYVGEQLWNKHAAQMIINLTEMFGGAPNEISRHLFEIYGHLIFSQGGKTLRCRNLDNNRTTELFLNSFHGNRESFSRKSIPKKPIEHYYEPSDDGTFPAIDSLSPQGMFQFTVGIEHPIRGVQILQEVCKAFDKPYKLYFVVPPHCFEKFTKQPYKATKGNVDVKPIDGLEQYVLELAIEA